jgi:hypothetical protein
MVGWLYQLPRRQGRDVFHGAGVARSDSGNDRQGAGGLGSGGLFGAIYIDISIFMLPKLGATTVVALIVLGQMVGSLAFDHFGILGVAQQSVTLARIAGVALILGGVALTRF